MVFRRKLFLLVDVLLLLEGGLLESWPLEEELLKGKLLEGDLVGYWGQYEVTWTLT